MTDTDEQRTPRGEALYAAHREKVRDAFQGKKFKILKEIHLEEDQRFETQFGNKGRHGVILENVETGEKLIVGNTILRRIARDYGSVDLPPEAQRRKRRTKAEKAADDAAKAQLREEARALQAKLIEEVLAKETEPSTKAAAKKNGKGKAKAEAEVPEAVSSLFE